MRILEGALAHLSPLFAVVLLLSGGCKRDAPQEVHATKPPAGQPVPVARTPVKQPEPDTPVLVHTSGSEWLAQVSGDGSETPGNVAFAKDGGLFINGTFSNTINFGAGETQAVTGSTLFLARYTPEGKLAWSRTNSGAGDTSAGVQHVLPDGSLLASGTFYETLKFDKCVLKTRGKTPFAMRIDPNGGCVWAKALADPARMGANSEIKENWGRVSPKEFASGYWVQWLEMWPSATDLRQPSFYKRTFVKIDPQGDVLAEFSFQTYGVYPHVAPHPLGMAVAGSFHQPSEIAGQVVRPPVSKTKTPRTVTVVGVLSLGVSGQKIRWLKAFNDVRVQSISIDHGTGDIFTVGVFGDFDEDSVALGKRTLTSNGDADLVAFKATSTGVITWATAIGGTGSDGTTTRTRVDERGHLWVASDYEGEITIGTSQLTAPASNPYRKGDFVVELNAEGVPVFVLPIEGGLADFKLDRNGGIAFCGQAPYPLTLKDWRIEPVGDRDGFVARLKLANWR